MTTPAAWWASGSFGGVVAGLLFPAGDFGRAQWWADAGKLPLFGCLVLPALSATEQAATMEIAS